MNKAFASAVRLLARREHSTHELQLKLRYKGYSEQDIIVALEECRRLQLQCDKRYAETLCRARVRQGYGPMRIQQELLGANIARELADEVLSQTEEALSAQALSALKKKFKQKAISVEELQKQKRFLLYRGFSAQIIAEIFKERASMYPSNGIDTLQ